jgi:hypothetical protein
LDRANGQVFDVHPVQRILTVGAAAVFITRLVVLETVAPIGLAACLAVAMMFFFHTGTPRQGDRLSHVSDTGSLRTAI